MLQEDLYINETKHKIKNVFFKIKNKYLNLEHPLKTSVGHNIFIKHL